MRDALAAAGEEGVLACREFTNGHAAGLELSEVTFQKTAFRKCVFEGCDFSGAAFYECDFADCAFLDCRFQRSFWKDCRISGSKGDGGDFRRCRFKSGGIRDSLFRYANFTGSVWERDEITETDFTETVFQESRFTKMLLKKVNFTKADFFKAGLKGVDLSGCILDKITLSETCKELRGAKIHSSQAAVVASILGIEVTF